MHGGVTFACEQIHTLLELRRRGGGVVISGGEGGRGNAKACLSYDSREFSSSY